MIGLDTNVVVRYLTQDGPQYPAAVKLIESLSAEEPGFITLIVLVEIVWVLESCYGSDKNDIFRVVDALLRTKNLMLERKDIVSHALRRFIAGNADFADCLIERCGHAEECRFTVTFDRKAAKGAGMRLLE